MTVKELRGVAKSDDESEEVEGERGVTGGGGEWFGDGVVSSGTEVKCVDTLRVEATAVLRRPRKGRLEDYGEFRGYSDRKIPMTWQRRFVKRVLQPVTHSKKSVSLQYV